MAAGSIAAATQATFYGGAATGVFSALTSAGAAGLGAGTQIVLGAVGGSVAGYATPNCGTPSNCDNCN